jgi:aminopeptidase N
LNNDMAGFYRSRYKPAATPVPSVPKVGEYHFMFSTQFESCDARRAFPCFDEPNLKATFDFDIEIPEDQTALSNMPVKESKKGAKEGVKIVSFERTPIMSTYVGSRLRNQRLLMAPALSMGIWRLHLCGGRDETQI